MLRVREDSSDGLDLRRLTHRADEVLSRLYFAARDDRWRTIPLTVVRRTRRETSTGFVIDAAATSAWASHPLTVDLRYEADGDDLRAEFTAVAGGDFRYGRIGFCLLFGMDAVRGRRARSWRAGVPTALEFPADPVTRDHAEAPSVRFHRPFDALQTMLGSGARIAFRFAGEEFEFEDQRNWSDPSYKAYSVRPQGEWPPTAAGGTRFRQEVAVRVESSDDRIRLGEPVGVLPRIGLFDGRLSARSYRPDGGFHELNATRAVPAGADSIELSLNGAVHAADAESVLETTATHGLLVAHARALHPELPVRLAPVSFLDEAGDWRDDRGGYAPEPPRGLIAPRQLGDLAATWVVASAARAVPAGPDEIRYLDAALPSSAPAARTVARLAELANSPVLCVYAPPALAVLAVRDADAVRLAVANTGPDRVAFRLPDGRAAKLDGFAADWFDQP
jgi:hypothetical protein